MGPNRKTPFVARWNTPSVYVYIVFFPVFSYTRVQHRGHGEVVGKALIRPKTRPHVYTGMVLHAKTCTCQSDWDMSGGVVSDTCWMSSVGYSTMRLSSSTSSQVDMIRVLCIVGDNSDHFIIVYSGELLTRTVPTRIPTYYRVRYCRQ